MAHSNFLLRLAARGAGLLALLFALAPAMAQPTGSWQVHDGPDTPFPFGTTLVNGQNNEFLRGGDVPPASDPAWTSASDDLSLRWTGGQSVQCRAAADYSYFQTAVFPGSGDRYAISFLNVDDAAVVGIFNEENPGGVIVPGRVVGLRERATVDLTPSLMAGATNRVVVVLANVCGPSGTLHIDVEVEPGEGDGMADAYADEDGGGPLEACWDGVQTLVDNNYDFASTPDPRAERPGKLSFADAYARYAAVSGVCRELLEEPGAFVSGDRLAGLDAVVQRHQQELADELAPAHTFTEYVGYLDGSAGVEQQSSRVLQLCPQQHRRQFSCDVAAERIAVSGRLLIDYVRYLMFGESSEGVPAASGSGESTQGVPPAGTWFRLTSQSYDGAECLEGNGRGGQFGGNAVMTPCGNGNGQLFEAVPAGDGYVRLRTQGRGPGECLEGNARDSGSMNGAAYMDDCQDVSGQFWRFTPTQTEGTYRLQTMWRGEGECLEANGRGSAVHGGTAFMDECKNASGQLWRIVAIDN